MLQMAAVRRAVFIAAQHARKRAQGQAGAKSKVYAALQQPKPALHAFQLMNQDSGNHEVQPAIKLGT